VRVNGTLVEDKMRRFKSECEHFSFNKCPIYTYDGASAKSSTNSQEMDNSVGSIPSLVVGSLRLTVAGGGGGGGCEMAFPRLPSYTQSTAHNTLHD
jgi:hypothetical protein